MDALDIGASTHEPVFGTDDRGCILMWNLGAERLFGRSTDEVLGRRCAEVIRGKDLFGNDHCTTHCGLLDMVCSNRAVRRFQMDVPTPSGKNIRVAVSTLSVPGPRGDGCMVLHLLQRVGPAGAGKLLRHIRSGTESSVAETDSRLTARETEVLVSMADGFGTNDIAERLCIGVPTVRTHVQNILSKLGAHTRLEAVAVALRDRLI